MNISFSRFYKITKCLQAWDSHSILIKNTSFTVSAYQHKDFETKMYNIIYSNQETCMYMFPNSINIKLNDLLLFWIWYIGLKYSF